MNKPSRDNIIFYKKSNKQLKVNRENEGNNKIMKMIDKKLNRREINIDEETMKIKKIMKIDLEIDKIKETY